MNRTDTFLQEIRSELCDNILPFWLGKTPDPLEGGFLGRISGTGEIDRKAPRGVILNARILWAFSAAYKTFRKKDYLIAATRAKEFFINHFLDHRYGGAYWSLTPSGIRLETKKQLYAQAFAIYGLSEFYGATGDDEALKAARNLYQIIEKEYADPVHGGYAEARARDFSVLEDMTLSEHDINAAKTMNSHLHLLEAYANLYKVWPDEGLRERTIALLDILCTRIMDPATGHLHLYFNEDWSVIPGAFSYGHDIETSWLALEAAFIVKDIDVVNSVKPAALQMARAGLEGLQPDGSLLYESGDDSRQWWVEAENVVGNLWLWKYHGDAAAADRAIACWDYIKTRLVDREGGEWFWSCAPDGTPNRTDDKAGFWKCPYHNSRMCLQALELL